MNKVCSILMLKVRPWYSCRVRKCLPLLIQFFVCSSILGQVVSGLGAELNGAYRYANSAVFDLSPQTELGLAMRVKVMGVELSGRVDWLRLYNGRDRLSFTAINFQGESLIKSFSSRYVGALEEYKDKKNELVDLNEELLKMQLDTAGLLPNDLERLDSFYVGWDSMLAKVPDSLLDKNCKIQAKRGDMALGCLSKMDDSVTKKCAPCRFIVKGYGLYSKTKVLKEKYERIAKLKSGLDSLNNRREKIQASVDSLNQQLDGVNASMLERYDSKEMVEHLWRSKASKLMKRLAMIKKLSIGNYGLSEGELIANYHGLNGANVEIGTKQFSVGFSRGVIQAPLSDTFNTDLSSRLIHCLSIKSEHDDFQVSVTSIWGENGGLGLANAVIGGKAGLVTMNRVLGLGLKQKIFKKSIELDLLVSRSFSALPTFTGEVPITWVTTENVSEDAGKSYLGSAIKAGALWRIEAIGLELAFQYKLVDENYYSMAAPFLLTGIERKEVVVSQEFWDGKLKLDVGGRWTRILKNGEGNSGYFFKAILALPKWPNIQLFYRPSTFRVGALPREYWELGGALNYTKVDKVGNRHMVFGSASSLSGNAGESAIANGKLSSSSYMVKYTYATRKGLAGYCSFSQQDYSFSGISFPKSTNLDVGLTSKIGKKITLTGGGGLSNIRDSWRCRARGVVGVKLFSAFEIEIGTELTQLPRLGAVVGEFEDVHSGFMSMRYIIGGAK